MLLIVFGIIVATPSGQKITNAVPLSIIVFSIIVATPSGQIIKNVVPLS